VAQITGDSKEAVALQLLTWIAVAERKAIPGYSGSQQADRKWLLETYRQCFATVCGSDPHDYRPRP